MEEDIKVATEIEAIKVRQSGYEKQLEKISNTIDRVWQRIDESKQNQIETKVIVENLGKSMFEMRHDIKTLVEKSNTNEVANSKKWEGFWSKVAWTIVGVLGTIILMKLGLTK